MSVPLLRETTPQDRLLSWSCPPPSPDVGRFGGEEGLSLSDFVVNVIPPDNQVGTCIKRSDGRIYAIKKVLQTPQTWTGLAILERVKHIRNSFCPILHWSFENGYYIYLIMVCITQSISTFPNERLGKLSWWYSRRCSRTTWDVWPSRSLLLRL
jgi:serum/glucocorticoid-regulated kinase 2